MSLRVLESNVKKSFTNLKEDVRDLRKSRKRQGLALAGMAAYQQKLEKDLAKQEEVHELQLRAKHVEKELELLQPIKSQLRELEKATLTKKEYSTDLGALKSDIKDLKKEQSKLQKAVANFPVNRFDEIESKILGHEDIKLSVNKEINKGYLTAEDTNKRFDAVFKEQEAIKKRFLRVKREVLDYQRPRFLSSLLLLLSFVSFVGAAIALAMDFSSAANFLAIEGGILLVIGLVIKVVIEMLR